MEQIYNHWVKRRYLFNFQAHINQLIFRRGNHNRPLICPYEANDKFVALKFRDDNPPKASKKPQVIDATDEDMEAMVQEYAKAHCILDKVNNHLFLNNQFLRLVPQPGYSDFASRKA